MTLRAWLLTTWGKVREWMCPELAALREQNRELSRQIDAAQTWMLASSHRATVAESNAKRLKRQVDGLKRHLARYEKEAA